MKKDSSKMGSEWADTELKKYADSLEAKRQKAIAYLGDKWLLKGGEYTFKLKILEK